MRLYYRFPLSNRGVEEQMLEHGIIVSYESIRRWCLTFGPVHAAEIRRRRPQPRDTWHLDEMSIKMNGRTSYLWRAVAADGMVLDILVQERRNQGVLSRYALFERMWAVNPPLAGHIRRFRGQMAAKTGPDSPVSSHYRISPNVV